MLEPRRLAARAAAPIWLRASASRLAEPGYRIRHELKSARATRIEVVTEGIPHTSPATGPVTGRIRARDLR